jgi:hypothetical protein
MRRIVLALVTTAMLVALAAGSAGASNGRMTREWFHGPYAEASWETSTAGSVTDGFVLVSRGQDGTTHLTVDQFTPSFDADGNFTGGVDVSGETATGVSFTTDAVKLTSASATGVLSMIRCTVDANFDPVSCTDAGTLGVSADWTGQGPWPLPRFSYNDFLSRDPCLVIDKGSGQRERPAAANVVLGGTPIDPAAILSAGMGGVGGPGGLITVCPHG